MGAGLHREHATLIDLIAARSKEAAAAHIRDVHWSYSVQEKFIALYYQKAASVLKS